MPNRKGLEKIIAILLIVILTVGALGVFSNRAYGQALQESSEQEQDKTSEAEDIESQIRIYRSDNKDTESQIIKYFIFEKVDIKNILKKLSKRYDLEMVYPESISCLVTILLIDVTVKEALDSLAAKCGFVYTKRGKTIIIEIPEEK